jgi:hypothetical protein
VICTIFINMDKEILIKLVDKGLTQREIGNELGKSTTTIVYWLDKHDLFTKNAKGPRVTKHKCSCGETDPNNFYGNDKKKCSTCHSKRVADASRDKRTYALTKLGNECKSCGFDKYKCSLDIHHLDLSLKDENFRSMRGWSIERIDKEIESCVLLCKNCHSAHHAGLLEID